VEELKCNRRGLELRSERGGHEGEKGARQGSRLRFWRCLQKPRSGPEESPASICFVFRLASLAEGTGLLVIFQEFGHQILIGTANRAKLPTKQIRLFHGARGGTYSC